MKELKDKLEQQNIQTDHIEWSETIPENKQLHYWYGGEICTLTTNDKTMTIEANGDINFRLVDKKTGRELLYVKDKNGAGTLAHELNTYLSSDDELINAIMGKHEKYNAILLDGNWYECMIYQNDTLVDSFAFDDDKIEDCIKNLNDYLD